ncbi:MAG: methionine--tRNA ligase, partial [Rhodospirillales bacterium]|nr:methionine--tRNA ligase [Rhodospirillales bacterium]
FGNDGDFSHRAMVNRMNGELANDLGNLAQRVLSMVHKNCDAKVPNHGDFEQEDRNLLGIAQGLLGHTRSCLDVQAFHEALEAIWVVIRAANAYVDHQAPWKLRKENPERMMVVLYTLTETIRMLALILQPYMPGSCARMLDQLAISEGDRTFDAFGPAYALKGGTALPKPEGVFPRFADDEEVA